MNYVELFSWEQLSGSEILLYRSRAVSCETLGKSQFGLTRLTEGSQHLDVYPKRRSPHYSGWNIQQIEYLGYILD